MVCGLISNTVNLIIIALILLGLKKNLFFTNFNFPHALINYCNNSIVEYRQMLYDIVIEYLYVVSVSWKTLADVSRHTSWYVYDDTAIIILNIIYDKYQVRFRILKAIMACYQKCTHSVDRSKCVYQTIVHCYISSSM